MEQRYINQIFCHDSRQMQEIPDDTIQLMITSPPYNVTKVYDNNLTLSEYLLLIRAVFTEVYRVLTPTGIIALNIANIGRKPYIPLDSMMIQMLIDLKYTVFQEIIWNKEASAGASCAWGSYQSASNPSLRDVHEYIILATKAKIRLNSEFDFPLAKNSQFLSSLEDRNLSLNLPELKKNIWAFQTESAKKVNHPAPFRPELPYRLIHLFSHPGDTILDPFIGSGSVAIACLASGRNYVGYDINPEYVKICQQRITRFELEYSDQIIKKTL